MLSQKDKDVMKQALLKTRDALLVETKFANQNDLIEAVVSNKLVSVGGLANHIYLYLLAHLYVKDTQEWLKRILRHEQS